MNITISIKDLHALLIEACEVGAKRALGETGLMRPYLSKQVAYRMYGQSNIDRWINEGLIKPTQDGNGNTRRRINRAEVAAVAKSSNRHTYLNSVERKLR